ncbi:hypothetical protein HJ01_02996 [Flavobacterium frigoris PS1]|uniref:Biopterin-dependent aromatic amino acid hydroxylase family profile domain-containing protein n=1 Tax=Flavobacterium frigoris (strain PS1) TaxID=1086011 RepID=H7FUX9_FLAFP|nr:hypothetical protein HJ01_02996 [Flavobacterium frigoris PS1]
MLDKALQWFFFAFYLFKNEKGMLNEGSGIHLKVQEYAK